MWRAADEGTQIDASAMMPDGTKFDGPAGLKKLLLSRPDQFAGTVTEKLLAFALGRALEYYDRPVVRKILRDAAPGGYKWSSILSGVVNSTPFRMKASGSEPGPTTVAGSAAGR
jgi:hypothetical protein